MLIYDKIIDYFKYISMIWPREFYGLTIEYGQDEYIPFSIYAIVGYNGFYIKRVFHVDNMFDGDTALEYIRNTMEKIRYEVIEKGEKDRRIANSINKYIEKSRQAPILSIDTSTWHPYLPLHPMPKPKKIILNDPATIILWSDNTKTIVKKNSKDKKFDPEKGIALCYMKKALGNKGNYNNVFKEWIK